MPKTSLPTELLDYIVDLLRDTTDTLNCCCLVSKSWVPRSRKHLFARVDFTAINLLSWRDTFPDPSTSPARYTKTLIVRCPTEVTTADAEEGGWIPTFCRVGHFELDVRQMRVSDVNDLTPFHGFSPAVKSLRVTFASVPSSKIFNLICSFPLLVHLSVITPWSSIYDDDGLDKQSTSTIAQLSSLSPFAGSLKLRLAGGMAPIASRLLSFPRCLRFRELDLTWNRENDVSLTEQLVQGCGPTLKYLTIRCGRLDEPAGSIDLSKAEKLKRAAFACRSNPKWVNATLRTVTSNRGYLQISVSARVALHTLDRRGVRPELAIGHSTHREWLELDRLLAQLRESRSIHREILFRIPSSMSVERAENHMRHLFPELTKQGAVGLARRGSWRRVRGS